jgi:glycosyltransferase involved in cell wall biosynthesis
VHILRAGERTGSKVTVCENVHVYPAPIVNEGRIFKQTQSVARTGLFSRVIICGIALDGLPREEYLTFGRRIDRVGSVVKNRKSSVFGRVQEQLSWSRAVLKHYSRSDICVVNAHSVAVLPVCYLLSRRLRAKLIYDTHELETETATSHGMQGKIFKVIERLIIGKCDAVFVVTESIADWYRARYRNLRPVVIRNIPSPGGAVLPVDVRDLLSVPVDKRLFIHVGNIVGSRNIQAMLETFASTAIDDHIVFLGGGDLEGDVDEYAANHSNIHRIPPVPAEDVLGYVSGCDVGLSLGELSCLSYRFALGNKVLEYAMAGVPFFFTGMPEVSRLLGPAFSGWLIDDPTRDLTEAIIALSATAIEDATTKLASLRLPTWDEESELMIAAYSDLMDHRAVSP